jgi:hypothetical protein
MEEGVSGRAQGDLGDKWFSILTGLTGSSGLFFHPFSG